MKSSCLSFESNDQVRRMTNMTTYLVNKHFVYRIQVQVMYFYVDYTTVRHVISTIQNDRFVKGGRDRDLRGNISEGGGKYPVNPFTFVFLDLCTVWISDDLYNELSNSF